VRREAYPGDYVCVLPAVRAQAAQDNALAHSRQLPNGIGTRLVASFIKTLNRFGDRASAIEIARVAGPEHLKDVDAAHLTQVVQLDHVLNPLVPFVGGTGQLEAGLGRDAGQ
jgi:hypothetical protein